MYTVIYLTIYIAMHIFRYVFYFLVHFFQISMPSAQCTSNMCNYCIQCTVQLASPDVHYEGTFTIHSNVHLNVHYVFLMYILNYVRCTYDVLVMHINSNVHLMCIVISCTYECTFSFFDVH